jgi:toxin ParE1/3/4
VGLIRRTPTSRRDFVAIWDHIAQDNAEAADALLLAIDAKLALLSEYPKAGPARPELRPRLRSYPVRNYTIYYRPIRGGIELIRVLHSARDHRRIMRGR